MNEFKELKIKNAIYRAVMDFFQEQVPDPIDGLEEPVSDLTEQLFEIYETTTKLDTD